jgi:hypothetical protein
MASDIQTTVRQKFGQIAQRVVAGEEKGNCCGSTCCGGAATETDVAADPITTDLYSDAESACLPQEAVLASLGCGKPTALADLREGEVVLDLGSGGGIDVVLPAPRSP